MNVARIIFGAMAASSAARQRFRFPVLAAIGEGFGIALSVMDHQEHGLRRGSDALATAYLQCARPDGAQVFGVGIDSDVARHQLPLHRIHGPEC